MKYLITTNNNDKAAITRHFILKFHPDAVIHSLKDANISGEIEEVGTISDRAKDKAEFFMQLAQSQSLAYDFYIGIDDGFAIPSEGIDTAESYEVTDAVLAGRYDIGTIIVNKRAYSLLSRNSDTKAVVTETPFKYIGNTNNVERTEGTYPLSLVLGPTDREVPVADLGHNEQFDYYLKYAAEPLRGLLT